MAETIVSTSSKWSQNRGVSITTTVVESLTAFPSVPPGAVNVVKSFSDGVYRVSYDSDDDTSGGGGGGGGSSSYNYEVRTTTSTEPLKSFWKFAPGGPWELDDNAYKIIQNCEQGTDSWSKYTNSANGSTGLAAYAILILKGQDSVLKPSITLSITEDEASLPSMSEIGKIATVSNAPTLPSGANWILTGMNAVALADGKWRISREYRASGQGGWEPTIYS